MRHCRDCRKRVRDFELYCPRCSADLYARPRAGKGFLGNLTSLQLRVQ